MKNLIQENLTMIMISINLEKQFSIHNNLNMFSLKETLLKGVRLSMSVILKICWDLQNPSENPAPAYKKSQPTNLLFTPTNAFLEISFRHLFFWAQDKINHHLDLLDRILSAKAGHISINFFLRYLFIPALWILR